MGASFWRIKWVLWSEQARIISRYYPKNWRFALADLALGLIRFFSNPYRVCRRRGDVYGETPLTTLHRIVNVCQLSLADRWCELGSGRGKSCFWVAQWIGCPAIGLEQVPLFVYTARCIAWLLHIPAYFHCGDLFKADLPYATCVYVYSTCFSEEQLSLLAQRLSTLPRGAKVVTISAPLPQWPYHAFPVSFPWGQTTAYLHIQHQ